MSLFDKVLRMGEGKILRKLETISRSVNAIEDDFVAMSDAELRAMTDEFKARLEKGETLDEIMPEASRRSPFDMSGWITPTVSPRKWCTRPIHSAWYCAR